MHPRRRISTLDTGTPRAYTKSYSASRVWRTFGGRAPLNLCPAPTYHVICQASFVAAVDIDF